jgi:hypothetical protein
LKNLPKSITPQKKQGMIEDIRKRIVTHLDKSRPFKAAFNAAYQGRDQKGVLEAQKNYWVPWLLNLYARKVLAEETPNLVTKPAAGKPAPGTKPAPRAAGAQKPYKGKDGRWYKADGEPFTTQEILRGANLS